LAEAVKNVVCFEGEIVFDTSKPDGPPRKLLDVGKMSTLGWQARVRLETGIGQAYKAYAVKCR
jgi:GDP-L-fucose synthase